MKYLLDNIKWQILKKGFLHWDKMTTSDRIDFWGSFGTVCGLISMYFAILAIFASCLLILFAK